MNEFLLKEISEQPAVISDLFNDKKNLVADICKAIKGKFDYVLIAARGTSDNAARYAQYLLGSENQIQVALATPSLFTIYNSPPNLKRALVLGISQSGQSPDIVSVLRTAQEQGSTTLAITNDANSRIAKVSDFIIPLDVGQERAIAASKTFSTSLAALALLSSEMSGDKEKYKQLIALPDKLAQTIDSVKKVIDQTSRYRYMEHCVVLGRGFNYATAFEISLKVKELTRVIAVPYSSADFKHGPIATVHKGFPIIIVAPSGKMYSHILEFSRNLLDLGAELIVISDKPEILKLGTSQFNIAPDVPEWLSPMNAVIPGQLFARQLAIEKGFDSDNPEGLSKITETF